MTKLVLSLIMTALGLMCKAQSPSWKSLILGTWELVEVIEDDSHGFEPLYEKGQNKGDKKRGDDKIEYVIRFKEKGKLEILKPDVYTQKYRFKKDSVLQLGNRLYKVLLLDDKKLKIAEADQQLFEPTVSIFSKIKPKHE